MTRTRDFRLDRHTYPHCELRDLLAFKVWRQPVVFMRGLVLEMLGYLRESFDLILDHELWIRIAAKYPILHVAEFWAVERTHDVAKTIARSADFVEEAFGLIERLEQGEPFTSSIRANRNQIIAGLHVFAARRLID